MNGSAAKASRREIRRAIGEPLADDLSQMADQIAGLLDARDYLASQIADQSKVIEAMRLDIRAMVDDMRLWRRGLSRWQRFRWFVKL